MEELAAIARNGLSGLIGRGCTLASAIGFSTKTPVRPPMSLPSAQIRWGTGPSGAARVARTSRAYCSTSSRELVRLTQTALPHAAMAPSPVLPESGSVRVLESATLYADSTPSLESQNTP